MKTSRSRRLLLRVSLYTGVGYVLFGGLLWAMQDRVLFVGRTRGRGAPLPEVDGVETSSLHVDGVGEIRVAIGHPTDPPRGAIVFFGGNGEDLRAGVRWAKFWAEDYGLLTIYAEHPGYGESEGEPSVESFALVADAAARFARERSEGLSLTAGGNSLGSFCAMHAAASGLVDRVLLRSAPSSTVDAGSSRFPFFPVRWLLRNDFDNLALAAAVTVPVLILHGDEDSIVPIGLGRRLADALGSRARFITAEGCSHNDVPLTRLGPFGAEIEAFLRGE